MLSITNSEVNVKSFLRAPFSEGLRVASEVSGMFLAIAAWYGICKGGFGTGLAVFKKISEAAEKNSVACRLSLRKFNNKNSKFLFQKFQEAYT